MKRLILTTLAALTLALLITAYAGERSPEWPRVRKEHLEREPQCAGCGRTNHLQVHHIVLFSVDPALELEPDNLITLCAVGGENCHFRLGHGGKTFKEGYPDVRDVLGGVSNSVGFKVRCWREGVVVTNDVEWSFVLGMNGPETEESKRARVEHDGPIIFIPAYEEVRVWLEGRSDGVVVWRAVE
jgi:hypothetical protein